MRLTDKLLTKMEKLHNVFQLQAHIESVKAKDKARKSIMCTTMLDPKTIYPSLSKTAKAQKQTPSSGSSSTPTSCSRRITNTLGCGCPPRDAHRGK